MVGGGSWLSALTVSVVLSRTFVFTWSKEKRIERMASWDDSHEWLFTGPLSLLLLDLVALIVLPG